MLQNIYFKTYSHGKYHIIILFNTKFSNFNSYLIQEILEGVQSSLTQNKNKIPKNFVLNYLNNAILRKI
jgi:hypothetical protein